MLIYIYNHLKVTHDFVALLSPRSFFHSLLSVSVHLLSSGLPCIGHCVTCAQSHSFFAGITHHPVNGRVYTLSVTPGEYPQKEALHSLAHRRPLLGGLL